MITSRRKAISKALSISPAASSKEDTIKYRQFIIQPNQHPRAPGSPSGARGLLFAVPGSSGDPVVHPRGHELAGAHDRCELPGKGRESLFFLYCLDKLRNGVVEFHEKRHLVSPS